MPASSCQTLRLLGTWAGSRRWRGSGRQWHRFCGLDPLRLTRRVFTWALERSTAREKNWHHRIQQQFGHLGLGHLTQPAVTKPVFYEYFLGSFNWPDSTWLSEVNRVQARRGPGLNKLRSYNRFKSQYCSEAYVTVVMSRSHKSVLASFRCGTAPLKIETGRNEGLAVKDRTCFVCPQCRVRTTCDINLPLV